MKKLTPWEVTYALDMSIACGISYAIITQVLFRFVDRPDELLGGMWRVVATIFVFRESRQSSLSAGLARLTATCVSFALCLAYLLIFPFTALGMTIVIGLGTIAMMLLRRHEDIVTTGITAGPRIDPNATSATIAGMLAVSAMAVQNALVQVSLRGVPATAVITTNIARFTTDIGTILLGAKSDEALTARRRVERLWLSIIGFISGCCFGAVCEARFGLYALALPVGVALLALAMVQAKHVW
jgi:uncharacterized membrane protein YoaK (UPF0700 family)